MEDILIIGSGQSGIRLAKIFIKEYKLKNYLFFNTNNDENDTKTILLNTKNIEMGSGRNPLYTLEEVLPNYKEKFDNSFNRMLKEKNFSKVVLFNSLSGGSGSAINYFIMKNILIPYKKENDLDIISLGILPLKSEGNPACSNSIAMLNMYYGLTDKISFFPIDNDYISKNTSVNYTNINNVVIDSIRKLFDYDYFVGKKQKKESVGTLDKKEILRVLSPVGGFLSHYTMSIDLNNWIGMCNGFNFDECKSMLFLFKTKSNRKDTLSILEKLNEKFPTQLKVYGEVESSVEMIEVFANGVNLPETYEQEIDSVIENIEQLKSNKKEDKKINKQKLKKGKKSLFKL